LIVVSGGVLQAEPVTFKLDPSQTVVRFRLRHLLGQANGTFTGVRGTLRLDEERPENSSARASLPARTINTQNKQRDEHLRELFEIEKFPEIAFRTTRVRQLTNQRAEVVGSLTLHGIARPFLLNVDLLRREKTARGEMTQWRATGTLKRSDFGLKWSRTTEAIFLIGNEVTVEIAAVGHRSN
jgi:polyisoprenoid-binding protein YceI